MRSLFELEIVKIHTKLLSTKIRLDYNLLRLLKYWIVRKVRAD